MTLLLRRITNVSILVAWVFVISAPCAVSAPSDTEARRAPPDRYESESALRVATERYTEILQLTQDRGEYETSTEYAARRVEFAAARHELRALEDRWFLVTLDLAAGRYDADAGAYPVHAAKDGLLALAYGQVLVDRTTARRIKSSLTRGYAAVQIRAGYPHIVSTWVKYGSRAVPVTFQSAWTAGPLVVLDGPVPSLDFSPDSSQLAVAVVSSSMRLWDIRQHTRIAYAFPVLPPSGHQDHTNVVAFSPDGHTVVFGTHDAHVDYWDPSTNHVRHLTRSHTNQMGSVRFSPEGHRFLSASGDYTWQMWDYAGGVPESARGTAGAPVHDAVFLPDGLRVVTCDESGAVRRWDAITGADLGVIHKFPQPAISLAVSAALPLIAVGLGANGGIVVVSTDDDRILQRLPAATPHVGGMVFAPDGRTLIAAVSQPDIRVYDAVTGTTLQTAVDGVSGVRSVALNSTGTTMATGSSDGRVRLWHRVGRDIPPIDPDITGDGPVVSSSNTPTDVSGQVAVADAPAAPIPAVVGTLPSPIAPASAPESLHVGPKTYALLVGVDVYDNFSGLVNPVADITAVEKELRETYGVDTLLLANPTRASFLEQLYALASREYSDEDQVLVFFSGHGVFDDRINRGHLALRDAKPPSEDPLWDTLVSHENVRTVLERLKCRHVLLVVDSCFSGTLDPSIAMATAGRASGGGMYEGIPRDEYIARKMKFTTRRYITAGGKEFVPDGRPGQHSPFARQFLAALRNLGGDDGILTFEEIAQYMERVDPQPLSGELYGNEPGSSFVLVTQDNRLSATDTPFGSLDVEVIPSAATVVVGQYEGNEYGRPRSLRIEPVTKQLRRYRLPLGEYRLHVSASGHVEEEITVVISDEPLVIEVRLRRAP